LPHYCKCL